MHLRFTPVQVDFPHKRTSNVSMKLWNCKMYDCFGRMPSPCRELAGSSFYNLSPRVKRNKPNNYGSPSLTRMCCRSQLNIPPHTETEMLSFWRKFSHRLHQSGQNINFSCSHLREFDRNGEIFVPAHLHQTIHVKSNMLLPGHLTHDLDKLIDSGNYQCQCVLETWDQFIQSIFSYRIRKVDTKSNPDRNG